MPVTLGTLTVSQMGGLVISDVGQLPIGGVTLPNTVTTAYGNAYPASTIGMIAQKGQVNVYQASQRNSQRYI